MWLVPDTNQVAQLPERTTRGRLSGRARGLTVPPYVLAEILLRGQEPRQTALGRLCAYDLRLGIEPVKVAEALASLPSSAIRVFEPVASPGSPDDLLYRSLLSETGPTVSADAAAWANVVKEQHRAFGASLNVLDARRALRAAGTGRADGFKDVLPLAAGAGSFLGELAVMWLTDGGRRGTTTKNREALYRAILKNPFLRHFFLALLFYVISVSRLFSVQRLNRDPTPERDDYTDLTIALYVGSADAVVSADKLIRDVFDAIDPAVRLLLASEL